MIGRHRSWWRLILTGAAASTAALVGLASPVSAHPLDVYLQETYLSLTPTGAAVELDLSPGVLVAARVLRGIDVNDDHDVSDSEARTYLRRVVHAADLRIDGRRVPLHLTRIDVPAYRVLRAGYGTLIAFASTPRSARELAHGPHEVTFRNGLADPKAKYQVNAFVERDAPITLGTQQRDPTQRHTTVSYTVGPSSDASAAADALPSSGASETSGASESRRLLWLVPCALAALGVLMAVRRRRGT